MEGRRVLVGATGSVATIKLHLVVRQLKALGAEVIVVPTDVAWQSFAEKEDIDCPIIRNQDEWNAWTGRGDPVVHIELRKWAELLVIAPLDANTLAKLASGICDNLLTCVVRAWDTRKPWLVAPAMNTFMWEHPETSRQLNRLKATQAVRVIDVISKTLVCKDNGRGAMAEPETIVSTVRKVLKQFPSSPTEVNIEALLSHIAAKSPEAKTVT